MLKKYPAGKVPAYRRRTSEISMYLERRKKERKIVWTGNDEEIRYGRKPNRAYVYVPSKARTNVTFMRRRRG